MLEYIFEMKHQRKNKAFIQKAVKGRSVVASYGNHRIYRIRDVDFTKSPRSQVEGMKMSFIDYYKQNYAIKIKDTKQPLIVADDKEDKPLYLIPELCRMTGLDRKSKNDNKLMTKIASFKLYESATNPKVNGAITAPPSMTVQ